MTVISNVGGQVEYWLEYGPTKAYGSESEHRTVTTQQNVPASARVGIIGLSRSTVYHLPGLRPGLAAAGRSRLR